MKEKNLWILCGPSAAGKSTWAKKDTSEYSCYISRDEIRFSMLKDGEDYFAHEDEVYDAFVKKIQDTIDNSNYVNIYADATHLSTKSRKKLLNRLNLRNVYLYAVNFIVDTDICIKRNKERSGRARVPDYVVRRMCSTFSPANYHEDIKWYNIVSINGDGEMIKETRCDKCSKEMICSKWAIYPCRKYHRDAPDGGYYG